jgi:hypothetical protein
MADPVLNALEAIPPASPLAKDLLRALQTNINAPGEEQPAYRKMLSDLRRSSDKSVILQNVRDLVKGLEKEEQKVIMDRMDALEQRLLMTMEFEDLREEIQELKVAVQSSQGPLDPFADVSGKNGAQSALPIASDTSGHPYEEPREGAGLRKVIAPTSLPDEESSVALKSQKSEKLGEKADVRKGEKKAEATAKQTDIQKPPQGIAETIGWTKLSPETRTTILAVAGAVGVSALVHYMVKFFRGTKKTVDAGLEKARSGVKTAIGWGALALTGTLAFFGIRYVNRIGNSIEEAKNIAKATEEKGKKIVAGGKKEIEQIREQSDAKVKALEGKVAVLSLDRQKQEDQKALNANKIPAFTVLSVSELEKKYGSLGYVFTAEGNAVVVTSPAQKGESPTEIRLQLDASADGRVHLSGHPETAITSTDDLSQALRKFHAIDLSAEVLRKTAEAVELSALPSVVARLIVGFEKHPQVQWPAGENPQNQREKIITVVNQLLSQGSKIQMSQIFECMNLRGGFSQEKLSAVYTPPPQAEEAHKELYMLAAELVVRSCIRHKREVQKTYAVSDEKEEDLWKRISFEQFLTEFGGSFDAFITLEKQITEEKKIDPLTWDFQKVIEPVGKGRKSTSELTALLLADKDFSAWAGKEAELSEHVQDLSVGRLLEYFRNNAINPEVTVAGFKKLMEERKNSQNDVLGPALLVFCKHLPTASQIEPFFHGVFPDAEYDPVDRAKNLKIIRGYINDTMPLHQAVRFFHYQRMIEKGNPAGLALIQAEIFHFIRKRESGLVDGYIKTRAYRSVDHLANEVVWGEFFPALRERFPTMDKRMELQLQRMLERFGPATFETAAQAMLAPVAALSEGALALAVEHKVISGAALSVAGASTLGQYLNFRIARSSPDMVMRGISTRASVDTWQARLRSFLKVRVDPAAYAGAKHLMEGIVPNISNAKAIDAAIGEPLYKELGRAFSKGATQTELQQVHRMVNAQCTVVEARISTLNGIPALSRTASEVAELQRCEQVIAELAVARDNLQTLAYSTEATAVEARTALQTYSAPLRSRIARFGPAALYGALNLYTAGAENVPELWQLWKEVNEADLEGKEGLSGVLRAQRTGKVAETGFRTLTGPAYYLSYAKLGMGPATVAFLGAEALIEQTKYISGKIRENIEDIETAGDERKQQALEGKLSPKQIEDKLTEYASDRRTTAQHLRFFSAANAFTFDPNTWTFQGGDSDLDMKMERSNVRQNYLSGYLLHRLMQKVDVGDPFAVNFLVQLYSKDGTETDRHAQLWGTYLQYCQQSLQQETGTRNDLTIVSKKLPLETALQRAEQYAAFQMDIDQYQSTVADIGDVGTQAEKVFSAMQDLDQRLEDSLIDDIAYEREMALLKKQFSSLDQQFIALAQTAAAYEQFTITGKDGKEYTLADLAVDAEERPRKIGPAEALPLSQAYRSKKEEIMSSSADKQKEIAEGLPQGRSTLATLDATNVPNYSSYSTATRYADYLDQHPSIDPTGAVRTTIRSVPGLYWTRSYPEKGGHPYRDSFELIRETIRGQVVWLAALQEGVSPVQRESVQTRSYQIGDKEKITQKSVPRIQQDVDQAVADLNLVKTEDGYLTKEGYGGRYYLQVDGTIFWTGGKTPLREDMTPRTYIPRLKKWVKRDPMPRIERPGLEHELTILVAGKAYVVGPETKSVQTPVGKVLWKQGENGEDEWYLQGALPGSADVHTRNYVGAEQPVERMTLEDLPDIDLDFGPERKTYFFPYGSIKAEIVLRDGTIVTGEALGQSLARGKSLGITPMKGWKDATEYFTADFGDKNYRDYVYKDGKWSLSPESATRKAKGILLTINNAHRSEIEQIILSSSSTATSSYKHVLRFPTPAGSPNRSNVPLAESEETVREKDRSALQAAIIGAAPDEDKPESPSDVSVVERVVEEPQRTVEIVTGNASLEKEIFFRGSSKLPFGFREKNGEKTCTLEAGKPVPEDIQKLFTVTADPGEGRDAYWHITPKSPLVLEFFFSADPHQQRRYHLQSPAKGSDAGGAIGELAGREVQD